MHRRILFGIAAWLLGAATATAGSLLAVSLLGQGITGGSGPLLSRVAVDRALASEAAEPATPPAATAVSSPAGTAVSSPAAARKGAPGSPAPSPAVPPPDVPASVTAGGTVLASRGGDVVASCADGGAYLDSWSPAQGFVADSVYRGPARVARVTFAPATGSDDAAVTMLVSCSAGIPSAATSARQPGDN